MKNKVALPGAKIRKLLREYQSLFVYFIDLIRWRIFNLVDYKTVEICADIQDNLIILAGGATVESVIEIPFPYDEKLLASTLLKAINQSRYQDKDNSYQENVLEKYLKVENYGQAMKGRRLVFFSWSNREGYSFTPTRGLNGLNYYELPRILIGKKIEKAVLIESLKQALKLSCPPECN